MIVFISLLGVIAVTAYWFYDYYKRYGFKYLKHDRSMGKPVL